MQERLVTIRNHAGIHCRPASVILNAITQEFPYHSFEIESGTETVELTGILALISLGLTCGTSAVLRVSGPDEEKAVQKIGDLLENEFDFPPR